MIDEHIILLESSSNSFNATCDLTQKNVLQNEECL